MRILIFQVGFPQGVTRSIDSIPTHINTCDTARHCRSWAPSAQQRRLPEPVMVDLSQMLQGIPGCWHIGVYIIFTNLICHYMYTCMYVIIYKIIVIHLLFMYFYTNIYSFVGKHAMHGVFGHCFLVMVDPLVSEPPFFWGEG